jgi:superfamily II DNA or RNA helicase
VARRFAAETPEGTELPDRAPKKRKPKFVSPTPPPLVEAAHNAGAQAAYTQLGLPKYAELVTPLKDYQQRVVDRLAQPDQPGLVAIHGLGSGKTLTSIGAMDRLDLPTTAVVPASLRGNFNKELDKHLDAPPENFDLMSLPKATRTPPENAGLLIVDEAHRLRDPASKGYRAIRDVDAQKRLLLTASPTYNHPADIAPLVNIAAGHNVLPNEKSEFERRYVMQRKINPNLFARLFRGVKPGVRPELTRQNELKAVLDKWTDYHANPADTADFPTRTDETIAVPMSKQQRAVYDTIMGTAPAWMQYKIRSGLPPSKAESQDLNAFLTGARQAQLYPGVYQSAGADLTQATKQRAAFERFRQSLEKNPEHRAVVYSNYLDAGLSPYRQLLDENHIPYAAFTGDLPSAAREQAVRDYNEGKLKALLVSSAGGEGLDLKGTRQIQLLEPHFNDEKLKQVIGRGIRFKSHEALPEDQRNVAVEQYLSAMPERGALGKLIFGAPDMTADQYLYQMSKDKEALNQQLHALLAREN